ncbi:hypothetical protein KPL39_14375 [Clostridium gasigenes]|uniref:sugar ABC transporter substrate-binding protein n=1 Tax=Clostridium gasigenes TaxID=94869 RepID=UPI001C0E3B53|nr:hypothetical protein [Clostridium gasigenes]MBU3137453.1 hypothetical protein [Clostridium gasigenes]
MKKLLVSLLIATTTLSVIGCSSGKKEEGAANKEVALSVQVEEAWLPYYETVKETVVKKYPKAKIEFVKIGSFDHLDVIDKTDATNKDVADVFSLSADRLYGLAKNQVLASLDTEKMAEEVGGFKDFKGGLGGNLQVDGEYLAFPYNIETLLGFVNVANAKASGIDTTKPVEMTTLKYNQLLSVVHDAWFGVAIANSANFEFLSKDADGKFASDATKPWAELTSEQQKMFEGLFNYWKAHNEGKTTLWDKDAAGGYIDEQFKTGGTDAIKIDGPWGTPAVKKLIPDEKNIEITPLTNITFNGKPLTHWKGGWGLGINARVEEDAAKMEVATAFIKELVNPANAKELFKVTGKVLENVEPSAYEGVNELDRKVIDATYEGYKNAVARPLFSEYGQVWATWQNSLLSWSAKNPANAEAAYNEVKAGFDAMMGTIKQ